MAFLNNAGVERLWAHILSRLNRKVDKVEGKGLSTNDFTNEEKEKLSNIPEGFLAETSAYQQFVTDENGNSKWEDRTHYSYSELAVILPETTISGKKSAVLNQYSQFSQNLVSDHEYTVVYNGTEYKCKTQYSDILCTNVLGNMSLASLGSDTGEPFFFNAVYNSEMTFVYFNAEGDHVISINDGEVENVSRLDTKYLPTTVPVIQSAQVGQTIVVKSVDENATPTEWETMDINEKALPLTGGTLSGDLYANGFYVNSPSIYPSVTFSGTVDEELEKFGMVEFHENHRGSIVSEMQDGSYKEYYQFPRPADTGTENVYYDVLTTKNPSESLAKLGGLPLTGGTLSGDLKLTSGTNQRKINIYRNIGDSQYELQHSINYEGKGFLGVYKNSKEVNMIKLGENSTEFSKPITVSGGATGDVAARTRENLGITDGIPVPTTAAVGQTVVVKAVDENGKPTEWEAKDIVTETEINSLMTALKSDIPTDEHINELISTALASFTNAEEVSY